MALTRTPRSSWIQEGLGSLAGGGVDAVRMEPLARELGVTKGGFYWHFADRRALLEEMLDTWERVSIDEPIERVDRGGGDARDRLRRLFALASAGDELARLVLRTALAVRDWARRDPAVAARLQRVDNRRMEYLRLLFAAFAAGEEDVEVRWLLVMSLFVGSHFIAGDHGSHSRGELVRLALERLLS